jgi:hypothetical protein
VTAVTWPYEADGYVANTGDRLVAFRSGGWSI